MIVRSNTTDLENIAKCHIKAFPKALASAMGKRVVKKMLSWYLSHEKTFLFHVEEEGVVRGYVGGMVLDGELTQGSASAMANHTGKEAMLAMLTRPYLLFHPEVRKKYPLLMNSLLAKLRLTKPKIMSNQQRGEQQKEPYAGLVVIGVDPSSQGKGFGSQLIKEFERIAKEDYHLKKIQLSVKVYNEQAIAAYKKNGWEEKVRFRDSMTMEKAI